MPYIPPTAAKTPETNSSVKAPAEKDEAPEILVLGGMAIDLSCDLHSPNPALHTSHPSSMSESLGGVASNVAYALSLRGIRTRLVSAIGSDLSGSWAASQLLARDLSPTHLITSSAHPTARYVCVNDGGKNLLVAAADMSVIVSGVTPEVARRAIQTAQDEGFLRYVLLDGNLSPTTTAAVLQHCHDVGVPVIFEPTSVPKSAVPFREPLKSPLFLTAPNSLELLMQYEKASEAGLFETSLPWWPIIDALRIEASFGNTAAQSLPKFLLDQGVVQAAVALAPYVENQFVKLGDKGVLLVRMCKPGDEMLELRTGKGCVVRRAASVADGGVEGVGGLVLRYWPAEEVESVKSVNGAGDTFLGVLVAGLMRGEGVERAVARGQRAAVLTLGVKESVCKDIRDLV